jgi:hypothetical protein
VASAAIAWCVEQQREALAAHYDGAQLGVLGMSDALAEEVLLREGSDAATND